MFLHFILLCLITSFAKAEDCTDEYKNCTTSLSAMNLPISLNELQKSCRQIEKNIECMVELRKKCIPNDSQFGHSVRKPYTLQLALCYDRTFTNEYFLEMRDIIKIKDDWNTCNQDFRMSLLQIDRLKERYEFVQQTCCSIEKFKTCTKDLCEDKCSENGSKLLNKLTELGTSYSFISCKEENVDLEDCPNESTHPNYNLLVIFLGVIFIIFIH